jgi:glycosyltransferase involved in cell wall biosynthesis
VRIAYLSDERTVNAVYRSAGPMLALGERGHEVRRLDSNSRNDWPTLARWCELLHIHRDCDDTTLELVRTAKAAGAAVVWDDDDDVTRVPRGTPDYRDGGGLKGVRRLAVRRRLFEHVDLVTTPSPLLADVFRDNGAREVQVIENYAIDNAARERAPKDGVRVGWVAGGEHRLDLKHVPVEDALRRLLETHPHVHVTTIGVRLDLRHERYDHLPIVHFPQLLRHVSTFEVGIAPLSPAVEINHARSNVKVKEYAAVGVPWLASPIGPYARFGDKQGGRLVPDDDWFASLDALIGSDRTRRKLAKRAAKWGREQLLSRNIGHWERALGDAVSGDRERTHDDPALGLLRKSV